MAIERDVFAVVPIAAENDQSRDRLERLVQSAETIRQRIPEYLGMTAFGSCVRGEAKETSDVDIYVHLDGTRSTMEDFENESFLVHEPCALDEDMAGSSNYRFDLNYAYKMTIKDILAEHGIHEVDLIAAPTSSKLVEDSARQALRAAEYWNIGEKDYGAVAPRNIRGLFHVPIDSERLEPFQRQALDLFANSKHGETAWRMMRMMVAEYEVGTGRHLPDLSHREIPESLNDARPYYLGSE